MDLYVPYVPYKSQNSYTSCQKASKAKVLYIDFRWEKKGADTKKQIENMFSCSFMTIEEHE